MPDPDGHGHCKIDLTNHVNRTAQFADGLKITVTMTRTGKPDVVFVFDPDGDLSSLAPGTSAFIDGSFDVFEPGAYSYSATTVVSWP